MFRTVTINPLTFCYERDFKHLNGIDAYGRMTTVIDTNEVAPPEANIESFSIERTLRDTGCSNHDFRRCTSEGTMFHSYLRTSKGATLRSYRQPRSIGGDNRKAAVPKLLRRLAPKQLLVAPFGDTHILVG